MQTRVSLMLALCAAAVVVFFLVYPNGDYSTMPAYFPRCFVVQELVQQPHAARLEEVTRFLERPGLCAQSEQTFGVMAAALLAV